MTENEILSKIVPESTYQEFFNIFEKKNELIQKFSKEDIEDEFPGLGSLTYLDFLNIIENQDKKIQELSVNINIEKLKWQLRYILNDLTICIHKTDTLIRGGDEENTFETLFKEIESIKSFTKKLKNYELVKKN